MEKNFFENESFKALCYRLKEQLAELELNDFQEGNHSYDAIKLSESLKVSRSATLKSDEKIDKDNKKKAAAATFLKDLTEPTELQRGANITEKWREGQKQLFLLFRNSLMYETLSNNKLKKSWVNEYLQLVKIMQRIASIQNFLPKKRKIVPAKENVQEEEPEINPYSTNPTDIPKPFGNVGK